MTGLHRRAMVFALPLIGMAGAAAACSRGELAKTAQAGARGPRPDLYNCEGCEAIAERDPAVISARTTLAGPAEPGERMRLEGRVLAVDGTTPAEGVVIYAHQTNAEGFYANGAPETEWSRRHGRLRGWVRTSADGRYVFDTIKPAPYPGLTMPAHIHLFLGEPGRPPYYIDDVVFEGEFGVTPEYRAASELRGGDGVVRLTREADVWVARRDIRLEPHP